jgi:hypothetical protein
MNHNFKLRDVVKTLDDKKCCGIIYAISCFGATSKGGRSCPIAECTFHEQDYIFVQWEDKTTYSYHHSELTIDETIPEPITERMIPIAEEVLVEENHFDWNLYNGFSKIKYDTRTGQQYIQLSFEEELNRPAIENDEINWNVYCGYERGSYRKSFIPNN